jgi:uncharacterized Tic20 family protein
MTSNPPQPEPEWPASGPPSSGPLDALPPAEDGLAAADGRWHTGPQPSWPAGSQRVREAGSRWPAARAPWPGAEPDRAAAVLERGTGQQAAVTAREAEEPKGRAGTAEPGEERLAALSYLSVPFLGPLVPLAVYVIKRGRSRYVRRQSAQALNLSLTALLYTLCALIAGAMLALDSLTVALFAVVPVAAALWLVTLVYVLLAASRAGRGGYFKIPAWLCASILH